MFFKNKTFKMPSCGQYYKDRLLYLYLDSHLNFSEFEHYCLYKFILEQVQNDHLDVAELIYGQTIPLSLKLPKTSKSLGGRTTAVLASFYVNPWYCCLFLEVLGRFCETYSTNRWKIVDSFEKNYVWMYQYKCLQINPAICLRYL